MSAREDILGAIRGGLGRGPLAGAQVAALEERLRTPVANLIPARGRIDHDRQIDLFMEEARRVDATVTRVGAAEDVPRAVARYLAEHNLPTRLKVAPDAALKEIPWRGGTALGVDFGPADDGDTVGVSGAYAGIAETGTVMIASAAASPTTLNYLPGTHIVVLPASRIVGTYEDAWTRWRATAGPGNMPRAMSWITGPSRTADIELTLLLGAHGPRRLHVVVIDDQRA